MPDLEQAGCILFWGYNPNLARIAHAVATKAALERGARLIVVDPHSDPATGGYEGENLELALFGEFPVETSKGRVVCRPAFDLTAGLCARYPPERVEAICGIDRTQTERAAGMLWQSRPVAYYAWSGARCSRTRPRSRGRLPSSTH